MIRIIIIIVIIIVITGTDGRSSGWINVEKVMKSGVNILSSILLVHAKNCEYVLYKV